MIISEHTKKLSISLEKLKTVNKPERDENIVTYNNTLNVKCELNNPHPF